jgi:xanthine dehydrogenase iron-sulfur cluster and FAD-binding subunit A
LVLFGRASGSHPRQHRKVEARLFAAFDTEGEKRLARNTPALQINISREGGKQVNVQGDVNGQKATPSAEGNRPPQQGA